MEWLVEELHHGRVLCRTPHKAFWEESFTDHFLHDLYVGFLVKPSERIPDGNFLKGSIRNQKLFPIGDKPENPTCVWFAPLFLKECSNILKWVFCFTAESIEHGEYPTWYIPAADEQHRALSRGG